MLTVIEEILKTPFFVFLIILAQIFDSLPPKFEVFRQSFMGFQPDQRENRGHRSARMKVKFFIDKNNGPRERIRGGVDR